MRKKVDGVLAREVDDGLLLLDTELGQIHELNPTASFIWTNLEKVPSVEQLAALLTKEFDVDEDLATRDLLGLLGKFHSLNLVVATPAQPQQ